MFTRLMADISAAGAVVLGVAALAAMPAGAVTHHHRSHRSFHHSSVHRPSSGIPQHDGGDRDADNNGGPSDGDGNV